MSQISCSLSLFLDSSNALIHKYISSIISFHYWYTIEAERFLSLHCSKHMKHEGECLQSLIHNSMQKGKTKA